MAGPVKKGRKRKQRAKNNRVIGKKDGLTAKQRRFVEFYVQTGNATEAAKQAGYSEKTAYRTGADNIRKPQIQKAIQKLVAEEGEKRVVQAHETLELLSSIARGEVDEDNITVLVDHGKSRIEHASTKVSINNRIKALTLLAKFHGLLDKAKNQNDGPEYQDDGLQAALNKTADEVWNK